MSGRNTCNHTTACTWSARIKQRRSNFLLLKKSTLSTPRHRANLRPLVKFIPICDQVAQFRLAVRTRMTHSRLWRNWMVLHHQMLYRSLMKLFECTSSGTELILEFVCRFSKSCSFAHICLCRHHSVPKHYVQVPSGRCTSLYFTLTTEHKLPVFENRLNNSSGHKRDKVNVKFTPTRDIVICVRRLTLPGWSNLRRSGDFIEVHAEV